MKKGQFIIFVLLIAFLLSGCAGAQAAKPTATVAPTEAPTPIPEPTSTPEPNAFDDQNVLLYKEVRNDNTGRWRVAVISSSLVPSDHAIDYYKKYFTDDSEIHFICNLGLKTTTKITCLGNSLYVDVYEYTQGEDHDAKVLPGGMKYGAYIVDMKTGEVEKLD